MRNLYSGAISTFARSPFRDWGGDGYLPFPVAARITGTSFRGGFRMQMADRNHSWDYRFPAIMSRVSLSRTSSGGEGYGASLDNLSAREDGGPVGLAAGA